jgi:protein TonB
MQSKLQSRFLKAFIFAGAITVALSWLMHLMVNGTGIGMKKSESLQTIDFVRLKKDTDLETRARRKPPPPPPPKPPPPPPKLQVATPQQSVTQSPTPFTMPNLGLAPGVGGGPFIGAIGSPTGGGDGDIIPLVRIQPQYPRAAAMDRIEGSVKIEFIVNPDGTVRNARVVSAKPPGVFEQSAITAALKWKFKPRVVDGKAVEQRAVQELSFKLDPEQ